VSHSVKLREFVWIVSVDDDEPLVLVTLGQNDSEEGEASVWFALDGDAAQAMGGALIRAYGVLIRRALGPPRLDTDLDGGR
jgi:hypothetical protein